MAMVKMKNYIKLESEAKVKQGKIKINNYLNFNPPIVIIFLFYLIFAYLYLIYYYYILYYIQINI